MKQGRKFKRRRIWPQLDQSKTSRRYMVILIFIALCLFAFFHPYPPFWVLDGWDTLQDKVAWDDPEQKSIYTVLPDGVSLKVFGAQDMKVKGGPEWGRRGTAPLLTFPAPTTSEWLIQATFHMPKRVPGTHMGVLLWNGKSEKPVYASYFGPYGENEMRIEGYMQGNGNIGQGSGNLYFYKKYAASSGILRIHKFDNSNILYRSSKFKYTYVCSYRADVAWDFDDPERTQRGKRNWGVVVGSISTDENFDRIGFIAKSWQGNEAEISFTNIKIGYPVLWQ